MTKKIKNKLFNLNIFNITLFVGIISIITKFVSIINNSIIANKFGTSRELDIYLSSQSIIDLIISFFTITFSITFIPIYIELVKKKDYINSSKLSNLIFSFFTYASLSLIVIIILFSKNISQLIFGFTGKDLIISSTVLKISSFSILFYLLSSHIINILTSKKQFYLPSFITLIISIVPSIIVYLFGSRISVYSLSLSAIIISLISLLISFYYLKKRKLGNLQLLSNFNNIYFKKIALISMPLFISASAVQFNIFIDRIFATKLPFGSIAALNYARVIRDIPLNIVIALPLIILPFFSEKALYKNNIHLKRLLFKTIDMGLYILIPSIIGLFLIIKPLINILFERGAFTHTSSEMVFNSFIYYLPGAPFYWALQIFTRIFYSVKKYKTVIIIGLLVILYNALLDNFLSKILSYKGIALSTSLVEITFFIIYLILIKKLFISIKNKQLIKNILKILIASIIMGIILYLYSILINLSKSDNFSLIKIISCILLGFFIYIYLSKIFSLKEYNYILLKLSYIFNKKNDK